MPKVRQSSAMLVSCLARCSTNSKRCSMGDVSFQGTDPPQVRTVGVTHVLGPVWHPCARSVPRSLSLPELAQLEAGGTPSDIAGDAFVGGGDFSRNIASVRLADVSGNEVRGEVVNMPARCMTRSRLGGGCARYFTGSAALERDP